jgi:hypothetical protein
MNKFLKYFLTISLSLFFSIIFVPQVFAVVGDDCNEDSNCGNFEFCDTFLTVCEEKLEEGEQCTRNVECVSEVCGEPNEDEDNLSYCVEECAVFDANTCPSYCTVDNGECVEGQSTPEPSPVSTTSTTTNTNQNACNTINSLPSNLKETSCKSRSECLWDNQNSICNARPAQSGNTTIEPSGTVTQAFCTGFNTNPLGSDAAKSICNATGKCKWENGACILVAAPAGAGTTQQPGAPTGGKEPVIGQKILPACALDGSCRSLNDLVQVGINLGELIFSIIGSLAFVMFVYGGFMIILSMGNADRVKKGQQILVAAVIGMSIAFGAYILVDFILDAFGVASDFRAV